MPTLIERKQAELDTLTEELEQILARSADEKRDLNEAEVKRSGELETARTAKQTEIDHEMDLVERRSKVQTRLAGLAVAPTVNRADTGRRESQEDPVKEILREIGRGEDPTPGDWVALVHRAQVKRDKAAADLIERATAHQMVADNPGLVPKQIVAPVVDRLREMRPLVASLGSPQTPPGPKFDRPVVTQHVAVAAQVLEKDLTASQKMLINPVEVTLQTHAGHLNISKQDIRWSQPSILNIVYGDFAKVYARVSDKAACSTFVTKVTQTQEIAGAPGTYTPSAIDAALGAVATTIGGAEGDNGELNHLWLSRDVAVALASLRNANTGAKVYNIPLVNGTSGDLDGIPVTIDPRFAAATFIAGDDALVEFWEDLEGFLSVDEPDVLGQMVGYAGYNALSVLDPTGFVKLTNIAALGAAEAATAGKK